MTASKQIAYVTGNEVTRPLEARDGIQWSSANQPGKAGNGTTMTKTGLAAKPVAKSHRLTGGLLVAGAGALAAVAARRWRQMEAVVPELRVPLLLIPMTHSSLTTFVARRLLARASKLDVPAGIRMSERTVPPQGSNPAVRMVIFEREASQTSRPVMLWIHGGGYVLGAPEQDMALVERILARLDIVIVSVDHRLAPENPFPAPLDDCYRALQWLVSHSAELGVDAERIVIGGQSAGGGLAAALVQRAVDHGPVSPIFQLLIYPMLDAATTARLDHRGTGNFLWNPKSNRYGWKSYLAGDPTQRDHPEYAVPARREDLSGLPPAWIGVGSLDLFHDEDIDYGKRLRVSGVACDVYVAEGAYHGFDILKPKTKAATDFYDAMLRSLETATEKVVVEV